LVAGAGFNQRPLGYEFYASLLLFPVCSCSSVIYAMAVLAGSCCFVYFPVLNGSAAGSSSGWPVTVIQAVDLFFGITP